jgi:hypothetical protein
LRTETHHSCVKHLLSFLFVFPVPLPDDALFGQGGGFFGHLRAMLVRWPNGATRENVISLMGVHLSQVPSPPNVRFAFPFLSPF